ncbi:MAG: hypothetical protein LBE91_19315 [Tannerella sp.]|nr:hypothetical protein [Tannerella sp.]
MKTTGVSSDPKEIEDLYFQGKRGISQQKCEQDMFLEHTRDMEEKEVVENFLDKVENILLNGTQIILNPLFDNIAVALIFNNYQKEYIEVL